MMGLAFPPIPLPYLAFVAFVPFLIVLNKREGLGEINRLTYLTAFVFNLITLYWVGSWTPNADPFLMVGGVVLLFFNPIVFLIPSTLYYYATKVFNKRIALWLLPLFWVAYEYSYTVTDFKFPWLTLGNGLPYFQSYIQIADIVGVYGLTMLILLSNIAIYKLFSDYISMKSVNPFILSFALGIIILPMIYGASKINNYTPSDKVARIGLIQPDFDPTQKWKRKQMNKQLNEYLRLSEEAREDGAEIIFWPETALPVYLLAGNHSYQLNKILKFTDTANVHLVTGMPDANFFPNGESAPEEAKRTKSGRYYTSYNSMLHFTPNSRNIDRYGKIKLVPFGEKVPLIDAIPVLGKWIKWNVGISNWNTGKDTTVFKLSGIKGVNGDTVKIAPLICIESIYPDFTAAFVQRGANILGVVTNDSWYGNSSGPYQHKEISVLRAIENRRSVVRAANGGISCLIDPLGRTIKATEMFTKTHLVVDVPIEEELTFYSKYPLLIPVIALLIAGITILGFFYIKIKARFAK